MISHSFSIKTVREYLREDEYGINFCFAKDQPQMRIVWIVLMMEGSMNFSFN